MQKWLSTWYEQFHSFKENWSAYTKDEQKQTLDHLEEMAGELIEHWTELTDQLNELQADQDYFPSYEEYQSIGTTYYELEMFEQAAQALKNEQAASLQQEELRLMYLGFAYLFSDELDKAKETFLYILQTSKDQHMKHFSYIGQGCTQTRHGNTEEAIKAFEYAKQLTTTEDVVYNLGVCYFAEEAYHIAKYYITEYIKRVPDDGEATFLLGCCQWQAGDRDEAWASWLAGVHLSDSVNELMALAYVSEWVGHHQVAIHCYKQLQSKRYEEVKVLHGLAWNYALLKHERKATGYFEQALALDPLNTSIHDSIRWLHKIWPESGWIHLIEQEVL